MTVTNSEARGIDVRHLGVVPYGEALELQERLRDARLAGMVRDTVLLLEHPDVVTFGRSSRPGHAPSDEALREAGYEVFRINRGGDVTWHGPGQIVGYPIVDLAHRRPDVGLYLRTLEGVLLDTLADFGVAAGCREGYTGVWVEGSKIASIGVGVRRWVTMHGFALNVSCDLSRFAPIVPCGLRGVEMTSMERLAGPVDTMDVVARLGAHLRKSFP